MHWEKSADGSSFCVYIFAHERGGSSAGEIWISLIFYVRAALDLQGAFVVDTYYPERLPVTFSKCRDLLVARIYLTASL